MKRASLYNIKYEVKIERWRRKLVARRSITHDEDIHSHTNSKTEAFAGNITERRKKKNQSFAAGLPACAACFRNGFIPTPCAFQQQKEGNEDGFLYCSEAAALCRITDFNHVPLPRM